MVQPNVLLFFIFVNSMKMNNILVGNSLHIALMNSLDKYLEMELLNKVQENKDIIRQGWDQGAAGVVSAKLHPVFKMLIFELRRYFSKILSMLIPKCFFFFGAPLQFCTQAECLASLTLIPAQDNSSVCLFEFQSRLWFFLWSCMDVRVGL